MVSLLLVGESGDPRETTWWSLEPLRPPEVPAVEASGAPIDAFIRKTLAEKGLFPSPEADRRTLIRRLTFNLHGLPPTPEEVDAFLEDRSSDAYQRLVDRLLSSPRYGERWGRHWLDVVHYGETHGYDKDKRRLHAWPYRDYVIRALNEDKPYARFVEEQLAGDVLYTDDPDGIVALGFIAAGPWDFVGHVELREGTVDKDLTRSNDRDDMVSTAMSSFLSLTVHCARCHDHKFDPIPQEDYYRLQAVFAGVERADRPYDRDPATHRLRRSLTAERRALLAEEKRPDGKLVGSLLPPAEEELAARLREVDRRLAALPPPSLVYAAAYDFAPQGSFAPPQGPRPIHLLLPADVKSRDRLLEPGALSCLSGLESRFRLADPRDEGARRAALARWITDRRNPLTWRSITNRIWHYHFGRGLVDTPNDFGRMGSSPTHPELLDWLAVWFVENGGSLKTLHRLIVQSATYRQCSREDPRFARIDGENRYLWRMNRSRLDAESVRDAVLKVSGDLDLTMGGPSLDHFLFKDDHSPVYDYTRFDVDSPQSRRRSIYRSIVRSVPDPFMECLDCADPSILTPQRNTTLTALQALALLNNPFMIRKAETFAERVRKSREDLAGQIDLAYRLALGRAPTPGEASMLAAYAARHGLPAACRLLFNANEFVFID